MKLHGKTALVTGADSGIGQAIATLFAAEGADLCVTYRSDRDGAEETARRIRSAGRRALVAQCDIGDPGAVSALFAKLEAELGAPDILVNNAGRSMENMPVAEMDDAVLDSVLRVNLMGPLFCCRAFLRQRLKQGGGGRIVTISSVAQHLPTPESAPYGMSKAGLGSLCRSLSREVAEHGITVNNVAPGMIETAMTQERIDDPEAREKSFAAIPLHRAGQPEEVAKVALFLASDDAAYVTGQTWVIDGGLTMNWGGA
ncbi:SDR family NAD(P)-dependent oxidoreductase [Teichococcus oryzae]|uniref:SDR family oxidoreductase n=1 Tax=Teichococcus oryzae TaxID=1608942 RepID=A0A5B2TEA5_9PROT|nr:SDR family NAD(P)-dependent oxidoreductase [Pseudoroseomonas oryzae]KAA2212489.1 SDR family oxidoreductase [Pseudoroseomonas oryzae]